MGIISYRLKLKEFMTLKLHCIQIYSIIGAAIELNSQFYYHKLHKKIRKNPMNILTFALLFIEIPTPVYLPLWFL